MDCRTVSGLDAYAPASRGRFAWDEGAGDDLMFLVYADTVELRLVSGDPGGVVFVFVVPLFFWQEEIYRVCMDDGVYACLCYIYGVYRPDSFLNRLPDEDGVPECEGVCSYLDGALSSCRKCFRWYSIITAEMRKMAIAIRSMDFVISGNVISFLLYMIGGGGFGCVVVRGACVICG